MRNSSVIGRVAAIAAVFIAVVAVAVILLDNGSEYQIKAVFANASQIVPGDLVEVSGNSVGTVSAISLTPQGSRTLTRRPRLISTISAAAATMPRPHVAS